MDEMHTYIGNKKYCWIWIAVDIVGKKFINRSFGSRGTENWTTTLGKIKDGKHWKSDD